MPIDILVEGDLPFGLPGQPGAMVRGVLFLVDGRGPFLIEGDPAELTMDEIRRRVRAQADEIRALLPPAPE